MRTILLTLTACLLALPAQAKYSGGSGTADDPYQIATAADLIALGETPEDYGKHFILTADIDLDPNLPGRKVFDKAVIAPDVNDANWGVDGTPFAGVFDGNGHTISHLAINGGGYLGLFGQLGTRAEVRNLGVLEVNIVGSDSYIGGLVGRNGAYAGASAILTNCYSTGSVRGSSYIGGLVGYNSGSVTLCYSSGEVKGGGDVGGLVGCNKCGDVSQCYSTGPVTGGGDVGGLVGNNEGGYVTVCYSSGTVSGGGGVGGLVGSSSEWGTVTLCYSSGEVSGERGVGGLVGSGGLALGADSFWDTQTSGQIESSVGTGKTTAEMQIASTFLEAGWDFVGETVNGSEDIWKIAEGKGYPRFTWEQGPARPYCPSQGAVDVLQPVDLRWNTGGRGMLHDIYFGEDEAAVAHATPASPGIYCGRQPAEMATYEPGNLAWVKTYYWRIDEVNQTDTGIVWKGKVWSFTTADFIVLSVVDDIESYTDEVSGHIFRTWLDGGGWTDPKPGYPGNGTGSYVGNTNPPFAEQTIVHGGRQSMPMDYNNVNEPWYAEAERTWETPQDWTAGAPDTLTLYFRGKPDNSPEPPYVRIEDSGGRMAAVVHPDPNAVLATEWQKWHIALGEVRAAGVDVAAVKKMVIGVGDHKNSKPGGTGRIYIDDIRLTKRMP